MNLYPLVLACVIVFALLMERLRRAVVTLSNTVAKTALAHMNVKAMIREQQDEADERPSSMRHDRLSDRARAEGAGGGQGSRQEKVPS